MSQSASMKDVQHQSLRDLLGTRGMSAPGVVIGSVSAAKVKTTNTFTYCIDGVVYTAASAETVFTDVTVQAASTTKYYLLSIDAAGTFLITNGAVGGDIPALPANHAPVGYVRVVTDATGTFVPATDNLSDAAVTDTYYDLSIMPLAAG